MAPSHFLTTTFGKDNPKRGEAFLNGIKLSCKDKILHRALVLRNSPTLRSLRESQGHFPTKETFGWEHAAPYLKLSVKDQDENNLTEFDKINDLTATGWNRQQSLYSTEIGGVLAVTFGDEKGGNPFIFVAGSPTVTKVKKTEPTTGGAPDWTTKFGQMDLAPYLEDPSVPTHLALVSLDHASRQQVPADRAALWKQMLPMVMTPGDKIFKTKDADGKVYVVTALPRMCDLPIGLLWPTGTTLDEMIASISGTNSRPYERFSKLLSGRREYFENWLKGAATNAKHFAVRLNPAKQLYDHLVPELQGDSIDTFILVREQFLWRYFCDAAKFHIPTDANTIGMDDVESLVLFLMNVEQCYPEVLGTVLPSSSQAFVAQLFQPAEPWPKTDWLAPFQLDDADIPALIKRFGQHKISIDPADTSDLQCITLPPDTIPAAAQPPRQSKFAAAFARRRQQAQAQKVTTPAPLGGGNTTTIRPAITPSPLGNGGVQVATSQQPNNLGGQVHFQNTTGRTPSPAGSLNGSVNILDVHQQGMQSFSVPGFGQPANSPALTPPTAMHPNGFYNMGAMGTNVPQTASCFSPAKPTPQMGYSQVGLTTPAGMVGYLPTQLTYSSQPQKPRYTLMQHASLSSVVSRQQCSPIYLHLGLLYVTPIPREHVIGTMQGAPLSREAYLYVREPTDWGKHLLTIWDQHGSHMMSSVRSALYFRGQFGTVFPFQGQITQQMVNRLPPDLLKSGIDVAQWLVRPDTEVLAGHFHPLRFQVALNPSYSQTHLPAEGWTLQEAKTIAALIYFYFSIWVCKQNELGAHGDSDDSRFRGSVLGMGIHRICNAPFTAGVQTLWQQRQRNCTVLWLRDLCSILECF